MHFNLKIENIKIKNLRKRYRIKAYDHRDININQHQQQKQKKQPIFISFGLHKAMATLGIGLSKVFILDKYFNELSKYWETEIKLQGTFYFILKAEHSLILYMRHLNDELMLQNEYDISKYLNSKKDHIAMSFEFFNSIAGIQMIRSMICISK